MSELADVSVEQTADGAVLRLTAKDPNQVEQVQRMAQMMGNCTGAGQQQPPDQP
jgi:TusA-related sulfurtransferase